MSKLTSMSPAAIKSLFSSNSEDILVTLVTIKANPAAGILSDLRFADNYTGRIDENATEVLYGITSNSLEYVYLPFSITLPNEDTANAPRCSIVFQDVTRVLIPHIRTIQQAPVIDIKLVLKSTPDVVELSYDGFKLTNVTYDANTVSATLTIPTLEIEPFPIHSFTPKLFPGLF